MGIFYSTTKSKGQNIGPQQTENKHGPISLACHVHIGGPKKRKIGSRSRVFSINNVLLFVGGGAKYYLRQRVTI